MPSSGFGFLPPLPIPKNDLNHDVEGAAEDCGALEEAADDEEEGAEDETTAGAEDEAEEAAAEEADADGVEGIASCTDCDLEVGVCGTVRRRSMAECPCSASAGGGEAGATTPELVVEVADALRPIAS